MCVLVCCSIHITVHVYFSFSQRYYSRSAGDQLAVAGPSLSTGGGVESLERYKLMVYSAQMCLNDQKRKLITLHIYNHSYIII